MLTDSRRADPPRPLTNSPDDALRDLYAQHGAALLAYAERFTADRGRAEDIVQETFLRAWRHLPRLMADDRPIRPWLLRVARRLLIDAARAARVRPQIFDDDAEPVIDGGYDRMLDQTVLIDAVRQLSPAHQQIVIETFFVGTPMHLTAARLGMPSGTARSRLHYALGYLRRQLDTRGAAA
jgi:RNA polymerase sigma-70 factor (ECF subfamily)